MKWHMREQITETLWAYLHYIFNKLGPRQNGCHFDFAVGILKCMSFKENIWISIKVSLKLVPSNIPALLEIMAWCRSGGKPLCERMMGNSLTHTWVTWLQWVKCLLNLLKCLSHIYIYIYIYTMVVSLLTHICVMRHSVSMSFNVLLKSINITLSVLNIHF